MSNSDDELPALLGAAVAAESKTRAAIESTRASIIELAKRFQFLIEQLPPDQVAAIGLRVQVVLRGTPVAGTLGNLTVEYLPALDEPQFEARPGAAVLYLEALGGGRDRAFLQIQSNPGTLVAATSSMDSFAEWLGGSRPFLGIQVDESAEPRLVRQWADEKGLHTEPGPDARVFLSSFLRELTIELEQRARFNRAVDLRPRHA